MPPVTRSSLKRKQTEGNDDARRPPQHQETEAKAPKKRESTTTSTRCPLCLEVFFHPLTMKCGHSFCYACVFSLETEGRSLDWIRGCGRWDCSWIACPVCRQTQDLRSLAQQAPNFLLMELIQADAGLASQCLSRKKEFDEFLELFIRLVDAIFERSNSGPFMSFRGLAKRLECFSVWLITQLLRQQPTSQSASTCYGCLRGKHGTTDFARGFNEAVYRQLATPLAPEHGELLRRWGPKFESSDDDEMQLLWLLRHTEMSRRYDVLPLCRTKKPHRHVMYRIPQSLDQVVALMEHFPLLPVNQDSQARRREDVSAGTYFADRWVGLVCVLQWMKQCSSGFRVQWDRWMKDLPAQNLFESDVLLMENGGRLVELINHLFPERSSAIPLHLMRTSSG